MQLNELRERLGQGDRARQLATRLVLSAAETSGATELVPIEMAHISACHYSGHASLDFAEFLLRNNARFAVPTHTNASLIACATPSLRPESNDPESVAGARRLMEIYEQLGATPMWTCAPYQQPDGRPGFGQHVAAAESNAVSFFNSVLGARTNKYGDFLDVSAAVVGAVPLSGLHTDDGRGATHLFRLQLPDSASDAEHEDASLAHLVGIIVGRLTGTRVPVIDGMGPLGEDQLKAVAAAAASSGSVAMFHVVGVTPEAATLEAATGGRTPARQTVIDTGMLAETRAALSTRSSGWLSAVCLGTPHFSTEEFGELLRLLDGRSTRVQMLVTTSRAVLAEIDALGWRPQLADAGVRVICDTCTYYPPTPTGVSGFVMTNSAKWAYYAPGTLGVEVAFGSLRACVESAIGGEVVL